MPVPLIIYFVSIPIIMGIAAVMAGTKRFGNAEDVIWHAVAFATGWPLLLPMFLGYLPFYGLYHFGKWLGKVL